MLQLSTYVGLLSVMIVVFASPEVVKHGGKQTDHIKVEHVDEFGQHDSAYDHKAILGSEENEKEFANLNPEQSKQKLGVMLDIMDVNKDKMITTDELIIWIKHSYTLMDLDSSKNMIKEYDLDKDGFVTMKEYNYVPEDKVAEEKKDDLVHLDNEKFNSADENKDGKLDVNEFAAFLYPYDYPHMQKAEVTATLIEMDKDKDGRLTLPEFIGMTDDMKKEDLEDYRGNFNKYDTNGDELLDADEIIPWVMHDTIETASDEAKHLIAESDADKDGKLTFAEILEKFELWVGSMSNIEHTEL